MRDIPFLASTQNLTQNVSYHDSVPPLLAFHRVKRYLDLGAEYVSNESGKLKTFEKIALKDFHNSQLPSYFAANAEKVFEQVKLDGVFQNTNGDIVIVEVALGGADQNLKAGPKRKMLSDAFKMVSAVHFLKEPDNRIVRRILIVRSESVQKSIQLGWSGVALKHQQIEVFSANFSPIDKSAITSILKVCIEEQVNDPKDP